MAKVSPIHSIKPNTPNVYHDDNQCNTRNNIEKENVRQGTGGRPLCQECARIR